MPTRARRFPWALACAATAYVLVRVWMFAGAATFTDTDSADYLHAAPLLSTRFFAGRKPWLVPLYWKLVGGDVRLGLALQLAVSIVAWLYLARQLRLSVRHRAVGLAGAAAVLVFSLTAPVAQWDAAVLTESLSLSLGAALLGLCLAALREPTRRTLAALIAVAALWAGARDLNVLLALELLLALAVVLVLRRRSAAAAAVAVACLAIGGFSYWSTSAPARWKIVSIDLVDERVLGDATARRYFEAHGMPTPPQLRRLLFAYRDGRGYELDPTLAGFRRWLLGRSRPTYLDFLLADPAYSVETPLARLGALASFDGLPGYRPRGFREPLPALAELPAGWTTLAWTAIAAVGVLLLAGARALRREALLPLLLVAGLVPLAVLTWDAEPREVPRHELIVGVFDRVALILLVSFAAEALARLAAERSFSPARARPAATAGRAAR